MPRLRMVRMLVALSPLSLLTPRRVAMRPIRLIAVLLLFAATARADQAVPTDAHYATDFLVVGMVDGIPGTGIDHGISQVLGSAQFANVSLPTVVTPSTLHFTFAGAALAFDAFMLSAAVPVTKDATVLVPVIGGGSIVFTLELSHYTVSLPPVSGTVTQVPGEQIKRLDAGTVTFTEAFDYRVLAAGEVLAAATVLAHGVADPHYEILTYDDAFPRLRFLNSAGNDDQLFNQLAAFHGPVNGHDFAVTFYSRVRHSVDSDTGAIPTTTTTSTTTTTRTTVAGCGDSDGDGVPDNVDRCPDTPGALPVDDAGCSQVQFCAGFDVTTRDGAHACKKGDWKNDEPLMKIRNEADCKVDKGPSKDLTDDRCVPSGLP